MIEYDGTLITRFFEDKCPNLANLDIWVSDRVYVLPTYNSIKHDFVKDFDLLLEGANMKRKWTEEILDCDNYAAMARAWAIIKHNQHLYGNVRRGKVPPNADIAFGQIDYAPDWGTGPNSLHRANFFLTEDKGDELVIWGFEPQTPDVFKFSKKELETVIGVYL